MIQSSVTIILPTYKEVDSIPSLIDAIEKVKHESIEQLKLVIVDDDSQDGTIDCVAKLNKSWVLLLHALVTGDFQVL